MENNCNPVLILFLLALLLIEGVYSQENYTTDQLIGTYDLHLSKTDHKIHPSVLEAFERMAAAAKRDGIFIKIVSGHRSYERQQQIWDAKFKRFREEGLSPEEAVQKIITYSTIPGTSRHHWGTDIDIIDAKPKPPKGLLITKNFENNGVFCPLKEWMDKNAATYGFYLVYTNTEDRKGFNYEPWHYSYAPISISLLNQYKKLDLKELLKNSTIAGKQYITEVFIKTYRNQNILDINPLLLPDQ